MRNRGISRAGCASGRGPFPIPFHHPVSERSQEAQPTGHGERMESDLQEEECPCGAAGQEADDDEQVKDGAADFERFAPQPGAHHDAQVREQTGHVGGSDDRAAVGGGHGILQAAGRRSQVMTRIGPLEQQEGGADEQDTLDLQRNTVAPAQLERRSVQDQA